VSRKRSSQQNRYYHGVVVPEYRKAFNALGHSLTNNEVHKWIKQRFKIETTTELSTTDWEEFIIKLQAYASNIFGIQIPDPNEVLLEKYLNEQ
jgi:hypothetical protein